MVVAIIVVVVAVLAVSLLIGFTATSTLATYRPAIGEAFASFETDAADLRTALEATVEVSHGMRVIDQTAEAVLVSTYTTPMHLYGSFGLFVRCRFVAEGETTHLVMDAAPKVGWASMRMGASLSEFELVVRKALRSKMGVEAKIDYGQATTPAQPGGTVVESPRSDEVDPGWYADPSDAAYVRWWDGSGWTDHVRHHSG